MSHLFYMFEIAQCSRQEKSGILALIIKSIELCDQARRCGLLSMDDVLDTMPTPFFRDLMQMTVDGVDPEQVKDLAWARIAANQLRGVQLLEAMVTLEAIHVIGRGMSPMLAGPLLSSYLGPDRDLYIEWKKSQDEYFEAPLPEGTDYFGFATSPEEVIQKVVEGRRLAPEEKNLLKGCTHPSKVLDKLAPLHLAMVLIHLDDTEARTVFAELKVERQAEVLREINAWTTLDPEVFARQTEVVLERLRQNLETHTWPTGGLKTATSLYRSLKQETADKVLEKLKRTDPDYAKKFGISCQDFGDISSLLDDHYLQKILLEVDAETLALALSGAWHRTRDHWLAVMSEGMAREVRLRLETLTSPSLVEVKEAQEKLLHICQVMESCGEIVAKDYRRYLEK